MDSIKLLVIEDNLNDYSEISKQLKSSSDVDYQIEHRSTLTAGLDLLKTAVFDLVLLDLGLSDSSGLDTLKKFQAAYPQQAVVIMTGLNDEHTGMLAVQQGALDYQIKRLANYPALSKNIRFSYERYKINRELIQKNFILNGIVNSIPDIIFSLNKDYLYTSFNQKHADIMKAIYDADIEIGHNMLEYMTVQIDRDIAKEHIDRAFKGEFLKEESFSGDEKLTRRYFEVIHNPIHADGEVIGVTIVARDITERKRSYDALGESEKRYRNLFEHSPFGYQALDKSGNILDVNQAWLQTLGFEREEVIGHYFGEFLAPEIVQSFKQGFPIFLSTGHAQAEMQVLKKDGSRILMSFEGKIGYEEDGSFKQTHCVLIDVTAARKAEASLKYSEEKFRLMAEHSPLAIHMSAGTEQKAEYLNPKFTELFGYTIADFPNVAEWWPKAYPNLEYRNQVSTEWQKNVEYAIANKATIKPMEVYVTCKDGSVKYISWGFASSGDQNWSYGLDLTDRRKAEIDLIRVNRVYSVISQTNQLVVRTRDKDTLYRETCRIAVDYGEFKMAWIGVIDESEQMVKPIAWYGFNDGYLDLIKISTEDIPTGRGPTGRAIQSKKTVYANDIATDANMGIWRQDALQRGYLASIALPIIIRDHVVGVFNLYASEKDFFNEKEIKLLEEVTEDIAYALEMLDVEANRLQAVNEVYTLNETLEQKVVERTAQLTAANNELESFSYTVSHDLRAPLRIIDGFSTAILEDYQDKLDEPGKDFLMRIKDNTKYMADLIDALLSLAKMHRMTMVNQDIDLTQLAETVIKRLLEDQPGRKVEFKIERNLAAYGDKQLIEIALMNLFSNALKFTIQKEIAVIEFCRKYVDGKPVFCIQDNGVGFDELYASKIFGAFQRFHSADVYPGIGIGLATVQRIIHRHGGNVWAESKQGKGAVFYFTMWDN